jgi:hypothetical protein
MERGNIVKKVKHMREQSVAPIIYGLIPVLANTKHILLVISFLNISSLCCAEKITYEDYKGMDDKPVFCNSTTDYERKLRDLVIGATILTTSEMQLSNTVIIDGNNYYAPDFWGNVDNESADKIRNYILSMAPQYQSNQYGISLVISDLDLDLEPEIIIACRKTVPYQNNKEYATNYMCIYIFDWNGKEYVKDAYGMFLYGQLVSIANIGFGKGKSVMITWDSCDECEPTTFMGVIVNNKINNGHRPLLRFNLGKDYGWHEGFEYAEYRPEVYGAFNVSSRFIKVDTERAPNVVQIFSCDYMKTDPFWIKNNKEYKKKVPPKEYWEYYCTGIECKPVIHMGEMPGHFKKYWDKGVVIKEHYFAK